MQIHVVSPGDTLVKIAQAYSISAQEIAAANQVPDRNRLVVGQTLVIPINGQYHWIEAGESLWSSLLFVMVLASALIRPHKLRGLDIRIRRGNGMKSGLKMLAACKLNLI